MEKKPDLISCPKCGMHWQFVFSNGEKSEDFYFLQKGQELLSKARLKGDVGDIESDFLLKKLKESPVPTYMNFEEKVSFTIGSLFNKFSIPISEESKCLITKEILVSLD